jgi:hypothetical protein
MRECVHPSTFIREEMLARGWSIDRLAVAMAQASGGNPSLMKLEVQFYLEIAPSSDLRLGATGVAISRAFGLSDGFFDRIESAWLSCVG